MYRQLSRRLPVPRRACLSRAAYTPAILHSVPTCSSLLSSSTTSLGQRHERRHFATPPPHINASSLSTELYHSLSDATMEHTLELLENLLDEIDDTSYEVDYSSGVLTLKLGGHGTYVINKQPPNKQIWLSSPISGPARYDYDEAKKDWVYIRRGDTLAELLSRELSDTLEAPVDLNYRAVLDNVVN